MGVDNSELVVRQLFVASINADTSIADWQAYRVLADSVGVASLLPRVWYEDSLVTRTAGQVEISGNADQISQPGLSEEEQRSYQLSELVVLSEDEGRLVPMTSFAGTPYWSELNFLSNMAPLPHDLRVGSWSRLDQSINALADLVGEVFVVSGPLYESENGFDDEGLPQPSAYFKVISTPSAASAFVFESDVQQHIDYCAKISDIETVQRGAGLRLYPQRSSAFDSTLHAELNCRI